MIWMFLQTIASASPFLDTDKGVDPSALLNWKQGQEAFYDCPIMCGMRASLKQRVLAETEDSLTFEEQFKCTPGEETRTYHIQKKTGQVTLLGKTSSRPLYLKGLGLRPFLEKSCLLSASTATPLQPTLPMKPFMTCYGTHSLLYQKGTLP